MAQQSIRFDDGAAYERMMAVWSRSVGEVFLNWLAPAQGLRWIDVGCGNGAFTELLMRRCAPAEIHGIDPSDAQITFARAKPGTQGAVFHQGDAMALPFDGGKFDAAVMALVIFFVPDPAKGVAEMARVVRPGGTVAAYAWDVLGGGSPTEPVNAALRAACITPSIPPSAEASRLDALRTLWTDAGLEAIETRTITVRRTFENFDSFWQATTGTGALKPTVAAMDAAALAELLDSVRSRLPADAYGRVTYESRANAVKGRLPSAA